jgi:hypothetical protein
MHYTPTMHCPGVRSVVYNGISLRLDDFKNMDNAMRRLQLGLPIGEDSGPVAFNAYATVGAEEEKKKGKGKGAKITPQWVDPRCPKSSAAGAAGAAAGGGLKDAQKKEPSWCCLQWEHQLRMSKLFVLGNRQSLTWGVAFLAVVTVLLGMSVLVAVSAEIEPAEAQHQFCEAPKPSLNTCDGDTRCCLLYTTRCTHCHYTLYSLYTTRCTHYTLHTVLTITTHCTPTL